MNYAKIQFMSRQLKFIYFVYLVVAVLLLFSGWFRVGGQILLGILSVFVYWLLRLYSNQQIQQQRTLKECEERYKTFLESTKDGVWRFELDTPIDTTLSSDVQVKNLQQNAYFAECNTALAKLFNLKTEDILHKSLSFKLNKALLGDIFLKAFVEKDYCLRDLEVTSENCSYIVSMFGTLCGQNLKSGWGIVKDITASKKYSKEREKLLEEAREAKKLAELANVEKDRIMANLSHELRTPLVSIIGYSEILIADKEEQDIDRGLEIINRNAKSLMQLIEDLLSISQATGGKARIKKEKFNLKELIEYRVESLKYKYKEKNIDVICQGTDLEVTADQLKIGQIFSNLFSNAIKFTEKGTISIKWGVSEENSFFFTVADTGMGIDNKNLKHLFSPYFQVDKGITKATKGVGLGLYIAKTFVNLHKGRIEVKSEPNEGSSFTVLLPLNGNDLRILNKTLEGVHILLAEDDENVGEITKLMLERQGTMVTWVKSAIEVRKVLKQESFDIYIFDIAMPKEDGITLLKKLRAKNDLTPAIAVSAYADYEEHCIKGGFNTFILKPLTTEKMNEIKSLLN
jgi:signal transduction histidine kinase